MFRHIVKKEEIQAILHHCMLKTENQFIPVVACKGGTLGGSPRIGHDVLEGFRPIGSAFAHATQEYLYTFSPPPYNRGEHGVSLKDIVYIEVFPHQLPDAKPAADDYWVANAAFMEPDIRQNELTIEEQAYIRARRWTLPLFMLMQAATIIDNACVMIQQWQDKPQIRLAALKCIEHMTMLGVSLPIQHLQVIANEAASDHRECAEIAQRLYESQRGDRLFHGRGLI